MAKVGMDSFLLDCHTNENVSEIEAEFSLKGFGVLVRLWQKIYFEKGYYAEWSERSPLLFLSDWFGGNSGVTVSLINEIVNRCLKNGIFNAGMYKDYSILTSARIQRQYFDYAKRRGEILVKKEYLLVSVDKIKGIVYENGISACRNSKNACKNGTSKLNITKEKEIKNNNVVLRFEDFFEAYPCRQRRNQAETAYCDLLIAGDATEDDLVEAAKNYAEFIQETGQKVCYPNNFLKNCVFEDYLPGKYVKPQAKRQVPVKAKNAFNQFEQNNYDFDQLEKELTGGW